MFKNTSLRIKIMGMLIGTCLVLGATILVLFEWTVATSEQEKLQTYGGYAAGLSDSISAQFYERYGDVQAFAMNDVLLTLKADLIAEELNQYAALYGIYDLIVMVDLNGKLIASNTKGPDGTALKTDDLKKMNFASTPWFQASVAQKYTEDKEKGFLGTFVEDAQIDALSSAVYGKTMYGNSFSTIVKDAKDRPMAVITARPGFRWVEGEYTRLYKRLAAEGLGSTEISLLNKAGDVIVHYDPHENAGKLDVIRDFDHFIYKKNLAQEGFTAAKEVIAGRSGALYQERNGTSEAYGYAPVHGDKFIDSFGWNVVVQVHRSELIASLLSARKQFWMSVLVCIGIAGFLSTLFTNRLSNALLKLASDLTNFSLDVAKASVDIAASSNELTQASTQQASALQETVAAIDEINAMVNKNAETAKLSADVSNVSESSAVAGQATVQKMLKAINNISDSNAAIMNEINHSNQEISEIVKVIAEIATKTKVINDIVFQTKLLSFNASVEAARAGEHGKGFAVVAEEVGNLAQMSGNAAKEISSMLDSSIQKVERIVEQSKSKVTALMIDGKEKVDAGIRTAQDCGRVLDEIHANVTRVNQMVIDIATASKEQAMGVHEVTKAMNQLDQATQQNLGTAQESSTSAEDLNGRSEGLKNVSFELLNLIGSNQKKRA